MIALSTSIRYIKHPSWRVYKAISHCGLNVEDFKLKDFEKVNATNTNKDAPRLEVYIPSAVSDDLTNELCKALVDVDYKDTSYPITDCLTTFLSVEGRQLIEVLLLNGKPITEICNVVGCSSDFALTYQSLFYDITVFKSNADRLIYMQEGISGQDAMLKKMALARGEEFLKLRSSVPNSKVNIDSVLVDTFMTAFHSMHKNVVNDDIASQEVSQGWANTMLKFAVEIRKKGVEEETLNDLIIALKTAEAPRKSIDELD